MHDCSGRGDNVTTFTDNEKGHNDLSVAREIVEDGICGKKEAVAVVGYARVCEVTNPTPHRKLPVV